MKTTFAKTEFFLMPNGELWFTQPGNSMMRFEQSNSDLIDYMLTLISDLYPAAFDALSNEYKDSKLNVPYFKFRVVSRFIRCNFAEHDALTFDIEEDGHISIEEVSCPLRGECKYEGVICKPQLKTKLSDREKEVAKLIAKGLDRNAVAEELRISPCTVNRHIANIKCRLHISKTTEIVAWVKDYKIE